MNAPEVLITMLVLRVIFPVGLLFWIGEAQRRRNLTPFRRA